MNGFANLVSDRFKGLAAVGAVVLIWSSFNIISRLGSLHHLTPYDLAALRFGVSGIFTLPLFLYRVPFKEWGKYLVLALFGGIGYCLFSYIGFAFAPASHGSLFVSGGLPFWAVLLGYIFFKIRVQSITLIALGISITGLILIGGGSYYASKTHDQLIGDLLFLLGGASYATFGLFIQRWQTKPLDTILGLASFSMVIYIPIYLIFLPENIQNISWHEIELQSFSGGIMASLVASLLFAYAVLRIGPCETGMVLALIPGLTTLGAAFILGEIPRTETIIGLSLVTTGAVLGAITRDTNK
jgi:drug/metabolite transporter (DMT)-like permease